KARGPAARTGPPPTPPRKDVGSTTTAIVRRYEHGRAPRTRRNDLDSIRRSLFPSPLRSSVAATRMSSNFLHKLYRFDRESTKNLVRRRVARVDFWDYSTIGVESR